jgi:hypothetical protein
MTIIQYHKKLRIDAHEMKLITILVEADEAEVVSQKISLHDVKFRNKRTYTDCGYSRKIRQRMVIIRHQR